jgi:2-oxoacid:acceptor oxidoreductase delta subunit (pyruvate/2-ketoisovalerate family)
MGIKKRSELAKVCDFNSWRDFTPMNTSCGTMLHNLTGNWRFIKPFYEDKVPPCQNGCPAGNDIEGWIALLQRGHVEAAFRHLTQEEPFPSILGRVCFSFCQGACNRAHFDHHINIRELERFVGDQGKTSAIHPELPEYNGSSLAVIGSGPAGMSAAYFSRLLGFKVTIFEAHPEMGGLLRWGIPEYRLSKAVVRENFDRLESMGIDLRPATRVGREMSFEALRQDFDYIFLATGGHESLKLGIDGEDEPSRVISGLTLLNRVALDQPVDLGTSVVIIGGGNTAIDAARTAVRLGADVQVIYRRSEGEMPAHPQEVAQARQEGVRFRFLTAPKRIVNKGEGAPMDLVCCEMVLGEPDESGRKRPIPKKDADFTLTADTIVTAIGEQPDLGYLPGHIAVRKEMVMVGDDLGVRSETPDLKAVFAGGDIIDTAHTVVHAVASGKRAAVAMDCRRRGEDLAAVMDRISVGTGGAISFSAYKGWQPVHAVRQNRSKVIAASDMVFDYFEKASPVPEKIEAAAVRKKSFAAISHTYTEADAAAETDRCLHCGRCTQCDNCVIFCPDVSIVPRKDGRFGYQIDYDYCKGCGICSTECPRNALTMVSEETPLEEE